MSDEIKPCHEHHRLVHGHTTGRVYSPTYQTWQSMLARCRYSNRDNAQMYKGRGISVCERWVDFGAFLADMGERPTGKTLDRIDPSKGYEPGNCRWATPTEQSRNTRRNKLTLETATQVALRRLKGESCRALALEFGISESLPREIVRGKTWKDALQAAKEAISNE